MGYSSFSTLFHIFFIILQSLSPTRAENETAITFKYTLNTKLVKTMSENDLDLFGHSDFSNTKNQVKALKAYIKNLNSAPKLPKKLKLVKNLYSTLRHFINDKCLIVVNNFEGADIHPTIEYPIVLRKLELAVGSVRYFDPDFFKKHVVKAETVWIPEDALSKLNGNVSKEWSIDNYCVSLKHFYSFWPPYSVYDSCIGVNLPKVFLSSRPWQCEVQVDLFMPDNILQLGKHTEIFVRHVFSLLSVLPSLRPPVHILVDTKKSFEEYDKISLASWSLRRTYSFYSGYFEKNIINDVLVTTHLECNGNPKNIYTKFDCNVEKLNVIYPCPECPHLLNYYPLKSAHFSFDNIAKIERYQKSIAFPKVLYVIEGPKIDLAHHISYYLAKQKRLLKMPLKTLQRFKLRLLDKMQMLGLGYASIYTSLLGNFTYISRDVHFFENEKNKKFFRRRIGMSHDPHKYDTAFRVKNALGDLHFVSCGSRGIEPFPFLQFVSVFNWEVWCVLFISIVFLPTATANLYKSNGVTTNFLTGILNILKVLLEQGNPFPQNFDKGNQAKFLLMGIYLAGLVISNAFKSENVYKIVLPRKQISYYNIKELIEDNFTIYNRITSFGYNYDDPPCPPDSKKIQSQTVTIRYSQSRINLCWIHSLLSELRYNSRASNILKTSLSNVQIHPKAIATFEETWKKLKDTTIKNYLSDGNDWWRPVLTIQNDLIVSDMNSCNKTAWMLPNYLAQTFYRSLRKSGKHSDVSVTAYVSQDLDTYFIESYVPSSILVQFSWVRNSGLLEWWPRFVNRSDLVDLNIRFPKAPSMSGNIFVIFVFLCSGVALAITCFALEFWIFVAQCTRVAYTKVVEQSRLKIYNFCNLTDNLSPTNVIFIKSRRRVKPEL